MLDDSLITTALKADIIKRTRAKRGPPRSDGTFSVCPSIAESVYESDGESVFQNDTFEEFDMPIRHLMRGMTIDPVAEVNDAAQLDARETEKAEEIAKTNHALLEAYLMGGMTINPVEQVAEVNDAALLDAREDEVAEEIAKVNHALLEAREESSQLRLELSNAEARATHVQSLLDTAMQQLDTNFETIKIMKDDMHDMQVTFANSSRADRDVWNASEVTLRVECDSKVAQMRAECDAMVAKVRAECDARVQIEHDTVQNTRMEMEEMMTKMRRDWDEAHKAVRSKDKEIQAIQQAMRGRDNAHNIDIKVFNKTMKFIRCYMMRDDMKAMYDSASEIDQRSMEYLLLKGRVFDSATRADMLKFCMPA